MPKKEKASPRLAWNPSPEERKVFERIKRRILQELKPARQILFNPDEGKSIEGIWRDCEKLYVPHRFYDTALDEWQSKNSQPNPYSKVMTALATVIAHNPEVVLRAASKEYEAKTNLIKALFNNSWEVEGCPEQLRMFVFNLAQYGFSVGRTYHRKFTRKIRDITFVNPVTNEQTYEEKEIDDPNGVYFENMNIWNCWFDDMAVPGNMWSVRDWCWREVYSFETFKNKFAKFKYVNAVLPGGNTEVDESNDNASPMKQFLTKELVEVHFYENQEKDEFHILANNVLLTPAISPLPYKHKRLSTTFAQWTPRNAQTIYGIGVIEALKEDQQTLDKIRNMSIDELVLSIYQMFFHGPSTQFAEGKLRVSPGRLVQVTNPGDINPMNFAPPGIETVRWLELIEKSMDEATGITKSLSGEFIGKTAFEVQQNKEAGLRKLKIPIENIESALTIEARNRIDLIQQIYSVPLDVRRIAGNKKFEEYLLEAQQNPEFYFQSGDTLFKYRDVRLNLEENSKKGFQPSKTTNSFTLTPEAIRWEGEITIRPQSTLVRSVELERQMKLDLYNLIARNPDASSKKTLRWIIKAYEEDPDELMPTAEELAAKRQMEALEMQQMGMQGTGLPMASSEGGAPTIVPRSETEPNGRSPVGQILSASQIQ